MRLVYVENQDFLSFFTALPDFTKLGNMPKRGVGKKSPSYPVPG